MARTGTYPLVDRIMDGQLAATLTGWRAEGLKAQDMAFRLLQEHDIRVSVTTVHRWLSSLPADDQDGAA